MTVTAQTPTSTAIANGVTTVFAFTFYVVASGDLTVELVDTNGVTIAQTEGVHYTVSGVGVESGGTVTFLTAPTSLYRVVIYRDSELARTTDYQNNGDLLAATLNLDLDRIWLVLQELFGGGRGLANAVRVPAGELISALPPAAERALLYLSFDAAGDVIMSSGTTGDAALRTDLAASGGSALLNFLASGTGANARTVQSKQRDQVHAFDFIPASQHAAILAGTSVYDAGADVRAAINSLPRGGVVWMPQGLINSSVAWVANSGVLLKAERHDISSNTNGSGISTYPRVKWIGIAAATMFSIRPAVIGNVVWGGGAEGIAWDGNALAATGVHLDNTKYSLFDGSVRNVTFAGVHVSAGSGSVTNFSMKNHIRSLEFVWGAAAACQPAHGLVLGGNGSTVPATQQFVGDVSGLVYNGYLVRIAETDNCQLQSVHGVVQAGGTGGAVGLINAGAQPSHHNVFTYCVGPVMSDNGLFGNVFLNYNSEAGGMTQLAGTSRWDGELVDYNTGERFKSPTYALRDKLSVPGSAFQGGTGTTVADFASVWPAVTFPDAATTSAAVIVPAPYNMNDGVLDGVELYVGKSGTNVGNYRLNVSCSTAANGLPASIVTPEVNTTSTYAPGAQFEHKIITVPFVPELAYSKGDHIYLLIKRLGADAADTNTEALHLLGARILYRSTGPDSAGSGTYTMPAWP